MTLKAVTALKAKPPQVMHWRSKFQQQYGFGKGRIALDFDARPRSYRGRLHA